MTVPIANLTASLRETSAIGPNDILALRRIAWPDGKIDDAEAEAIFDLNGAVGESARDWVDFFVEAMSVYIVRQQVPQGYVDEAKAAWVMRKIDSDGQVGSLGELELLVKILEDATNAPDALKAYALRQIETVVLTGEGPTRDGGSLDPGSISAAEVKLLRRILFAQAGDGPASISRDEADLLFRLKDATLGAANAPEWQKLFVQAVGNHLMAHSDYRPLARTDAARLDAFVNDTCSSVAGFFGRMAGAGLTGLQTIGSEQPAPDDHDAAVAANRTIAPAERHWLTSAIHADESLDPLEKALLAFIAEESGTPIELGEGN